MEKAKRRVRVCLLCVVVIAIVMGILYYYHGINEDGAYAEGTLVMEDCGRRTTLCQ